MKKELEQVKKEKENLSKRLKEETSSESSVEESSSEQESVGRKNMELHIAQLKEEIVNFKKKKPGYYVEPVLHFIFFISFLHSFIHIFRKSSQLKRA